MSERYNEFEQVNGGTLNDALDKIEALSLQVAQLREALERAVLADKYGFGLPVSVQEALNTTPNADEWIKRSQLELVGVENNLRDGVRSKVYQYKETK